MSNIDTCNIHGAAEILHVHYKTVLELIDTGALSAGKVGRELVLFKSDVYNYLRKIIAKQTAERMGAMPLPKRARRSHKKATLPELVSQA